MMRDNPAMKLRVTGHTDVRNSNNKNDDLSKARAESVANLLSTRFGVDKSRLIVEFKGATQPLVTLPADRDPKNEPMHNLNRRVEFEIVK
jgi:outer membrane protein OmpA-like peptidoglycan-associated protein